MPIIANTTSGNTFSAVRAQLNSVTKRINAFAGNESTLYANTINANVVLKISGTDIRATFAQNTYVKSVLANTNSFIKSQLANTNSYIATRATWSALTATNTAIRTLVSDRLQVANAAAIYQTKAVERAALANTNSYISAQATRITLINTNLTATNTAIRALDNQKLSVANAVATYATKSNPATSGLLAHTGRATISTNLAVTGNTTISGQTFLASGSVSAPSLSVTGDTNTGLFFPAADTIAFVEGGTEAMRIDSSGNVGIGTSSPASKLDVSGGITTRAAVPVIDWIETDTGTTIRTLVDGSAWDIRKSDYSVLFSVSNTTGTTLLCPNSGNVGIGTISPAYKLDVNGYVGATRYYLTNTNSVYAYGDGSGFAFTGAGYAYFNQTGNLYSQSRIQARSGISDDANATLTLYGGTGGYTTITGSARSPIFYDSDNTAYYVNPNSSSVMAWVQADDWFRAVAKTGLYSQSYGHHLYAQAGGQYWAVSSTGSSGGFQFRTAYETAIRGYLYWDGTDNFGLLQSGGGWILRTFNTGVELYGSARSPIFYDSDDTNYYVNPNGYSSMNEMRLWGNNLYIRGGSPTIFFTDTDHQSAMLHNNGNLFYILRGGVDSTGWATVGSGWWPCYWNLTNNDCTMGGNISAAYNIIAYASDRRLKENIAEIPNALDKIKQIRGVTFDWNDDAEVLGFTPETKYNDLGVIAQEIQAVLPQAVKPAPFDQWFPDPSGDYEQEYLDQMMGTSRSGENYLTVQLDKIVPLLIEGIKEQQKQIEELREQIEILKGVK